ncbi:MAG: AMP-binding protein, partial [Planctomycetota bacterium]
MRSIEQDDLASATVVTISHETLRKRVALYSTQLTEQISASSVVAIVMPNSSAFIISFLSVTCAAFVAAPLNPAYTSEEFKFYLQDSETNTVIISDDYDSEDSAIVTACKE